MGESKKGRIRPAFLLLMSLNLKLFEVSNQTASVTTRPFGHDNCSAKAQGLLSSGADYGGSVKMFSMRPSDQQKRLYIVKTTMEDQQEWGENQLRTNSSFCGIVKMVTATMVKAILIWKST